MYGARELPMISLNDRFSITTTTTWSGWGIDDAAELDGAGRTARSRTARCRTDATWRSGWDAPAVAGLEGCATDRDADGDVVPPPTRRARRRTGHQGDQGGQGDRGQAGSTHAGHHLLGPYRSRRDTIPRAKALSTSLARFWFCGRSSMWNLWNSVRRWVLTASTLRNSSPATSWLEAGVA